MTSWFDEKIPYFPNGNFIYKIVCFCLGKRKEKLSYKELYLLLKQLNIKALGDKESGRKSMNKLIEIYKYFHNNKLPDGLTENSKNLFISPCGEKNCENYE